MYLNLILSYFINTSRLPIHTNNIRPITINTLKVFDRLMPDRVSYRQPNWVEASDVTHAQTTLWHSTCVVGYTMVSQVLSTVIPYLSALLNLDFHKPNYPRLTFKPNSQTIWRAKIIVVVVPTYISNLNF